MLLSPSSARSRAAADSVTPGTSGADVTVTALNSVAGTADVPFLPLSPSSRRLPPSPELSASPAVAPYPVVVFCPPSCLSVVLFDPSSQQLTVYERRRAVGRGPSRLTRPRRPVYLPSSSPRSASPPSSASLSASDAPLPSQQLSIRQWRKRKLDGATADSSTSRISVDSGGELSVCPLCLQPWPAFVFNRQEARLPALFG